MDYYSSQISKLIQELSSLPGIGAKSAQRLAFHILNMPKEQVEELSSAILDAKQNVRYCKECFTLTDEEICPICSDTSRDHKTIMVVENTRDLVAYEKTGKYDENQMSIEASAIGGTTGISSSDLYHSQIGTMIRVGKYVFAVHQTKGLLVIDPKEDKVITLSTCTGNDATRFVVQAKREGEY